MGKLKAGKLTTPRIVQPGDGGRSWVWLLFLIVLAVWSWQVFDFGRSRAVPTVVQQVNADDGLRVRIVELEKERDELRAAAAGFEQTKQADRAAVDGVKEEVKALQQERAELKREVAFLKSLVSGSSSKLSLDNNSLVATDDGGYLFEVTLSKRSEDALTVAGRALIRLRGREGGIEKTLGMNTITQGRRESIGIKFKNFQTLKTQIMVPDGFEPLAIEVSVRPDGEEFKSFEQVYDWRLSDA